MQKAVWAVKAAYLAVTLGYILYHSVHFSLYYLALSLGCLLFFPAVWAFKKIVRKKQCPWTEIMVFVFVFLSYVLGECGRFYYRIPGYDKIMHAMSGAFSMVLLWVLFYLLKAGHRVEKTDGALAVMFCVLGTLAVAGLWEIGEYMVSLVTGMDVQKVLTQGIHDTMKDMMVCMAGAALCLPDMIRYYRGKKTVLGHMMEEFLPE